MEQIYPRGNAAWIGKAFEFITGIVDGGNAINAILPPGSPSGGASSGLDLRESEDYLLLDLVMPVLLWIHGGRHGSGGKIPLGNPVGLIAESMSDGRTGITYVQINYCP